MAPWPEVGERKAPDKEDKSNIIELVPKIDLESSAESGLVPHSDQASKPEDKEVLTLDEGQLKALLDEAMTYKNPKDREGKSELFNELLQEAEADESNSKGLGSSLTGKLPKNYCNLPARKRHNRLQGRECGVGVSTSRGGSLQNLHALGMDGSRGVRGRRSGRSNETLVSARQREGGSLPSNVNIDDIDSIICPNYTSRATLQVSETNMEEPFPYIPTASVPNGIEVVSNINSTSDYDDCQDDVIVTTSSCIGEAMFCQQQHVSMLSIPPSSSDDQSQLDNSEQRKLNANRNRHKKVVALPRSDSALVPAIIQEPDEEMELAGGSLLGLPLSAHWRRYSSCTFLDFRELSSRFASFSKDSSEPKAKSWDENGNSLGVKVDSNYYQDKKKQRRVKTKNDRNSRDFLSDDVEGFRGGADIDALMEYIESPSSILDGSKSNKSRTTEPRSHVKIRAKEDESRTIKRRKEKFQRCNSLEEISKTKLQDLTEEGSSERINGSTLMLTTKRQVTLDDAEVGKKSSWNNLGTSSLKRDGCSKIEKVSPEVSQDSEFHIVTKKHRKKKRRAVVRTGSERVGAKPVFSAHDRTLEYRHSHESGIAPQPRRKSASSVPPSDKSDSSDLDSVHSLPVSSTRARTRVGKSSVSGGSTPQASYADIAKTVGSSQDMDRGKCLPDYYCANSKSSMLPSSSLLKKDAMTDTTCDKPTLVDDEYPPLPVDMLLDSYIKPECVTYRDNKMSEERVILKTVPVKTVIPISITESKNVPDSYDVPSSCVKNLVSNWNSKRPPVILVNEPTITPPILTELTFGFEVNQQLLESDNAVCNLDSVISSTPTNPSRPSQSTAARESFLDRIIDYHNSAWDIVLREVEANRARYYDGQ